MPPDTLPLGASLAPALIGLLGVAVGATINGYAQYVFTRRRERNESLSHGRLVEADLRRARDVAEQCENNPYRQPPVWADDLQTPAWREGRAVLAAKLDRETWMSIREAFDAIASLRRSLQSTDGETNRTDEARRTLGRINAADAALKAHFDDAKATDEPAPARGR